MPQPRGQLLPQQSPDLQPPVIPVVDTVAGEGAPPQCRTSRHRPVAAAPPRCCAWAEPRLHDAAPTTGGERRSSTPSPIPKAATLRRPPPTSPTPPPLPQRGSGRGEAGSGPRASNTATKLPAPPTGPLRPRDACQPRGAGSGRRGRGSRRLTAISVGPVRPRHVAPPPRRSATAVRRTRRRRPWGPRGFPAGPSGGGRNGESEEEGARWGREEPPLASP
jgi:hypothetical protein